MRIGWSPAPGQPSRIRLRLGQTRHWSRRSVRVVRGKAVGPGSASGLRDGGRTLTSQRHRRIVGRAWRSPGGSRLAGASPSAQHEFTGLRPSARCNDTLRRPESLLSTSRPPPACTTVPQSLPPDGWCTSSFRDPDDGPYYATVTAHATNALDATAPRIAHRSRSALRLASAASWWRTSSFSVDSSLGKPYAARIASTLPATAQPRASASATP
jgi:hypothetical protein